MAEWSDWFVGKDFTADWTSSRFPLWSSTFAERRNEVAAILEVGSWEGRSAIFFLNFFAQANLTCVDPFAPSARYDLPAWADAIARSEGRFDANLAEFGARCRKLKATSFEGLGQLAIEQRRFDLIYVDGSHHSVDVYADAAMSWPLLSSGGALIFDDYDWRGMPNPEDQPKPGIDAFLSADIGPFRELHRGGQIIVAKG